MRTIAHLSDLHFGRVDLTTLAGLRDALLDTGPDLLVVSGDLTQRARRREFEQASDFLKSLPFPQLVVPGNHDVPLYKVWARWLRPFDQYERFISADLDPAYLDPEIAVIGINTARALTFKNGRINRGQVLQCRRRLAAISPDGPMTRIVVAHHPFILPEGAKSKDLVGRASMGLLAFIDMGVDLILSGHLHVSRTIQSSLGADGGRPVLLVQAGTATSTRRRAELNSFNIVRVDHPEIEIERRTWDDDKSRFTLARIDRYRRSPDRWELVERQGERQFA